MLTQECRIVEAILGFDIGGNDRRAVAQRVAERRIGIGRNDGVANHTRPPADAGAHQQAVPVGARFQHLGEFGAQCLADQPAGLVQDVVQVLGFQGELPEAGQHVLLAEQRVLADRGEIGHGAVLARRPGCFEGRPKNTRAGRSRRP